MKNKNKKSQAVPDRNYLLRMAGAGNSRNNWVTILPIIVFTAFVIMVVRIHNYTLPMSQFFWTNLTDDAEQSDFFAYWKLVLMIICAVFALFVILYKVLNHRAEIKRSALYIPMGVYLAFVLLSFLFSNYKEFAWMGYTDRFEGCVAILCYMLLLFFTINTVKGEWEVKRIIGALALSSLLLSLLGLGQGLDHDFFRTAIGQKTLLPNVAYEDGTTLYQMIDEAAARGEQVLQFTFTNRQIYQTVYNINYVSFYLTLLFPVFGMLFVNLWQRGKEEPIWKKIAVAVLFGLVMYNFIGSQSSGGLIGLAVIGLGGILLFNRKLIEWAKPLGILLLIAALVAGATVPRWMGEVTHSVDGFGQDAEKNFATIDYFETGTDRLNTSLNGKELSIVVSSDELGKTKLLVQDGSGAVLTAIGYDNAMVALDEYGYPGASVALALDENSTAEFIVYETDEKQWPFLISGDGIFYYTGTGKYAALTKVEHKGFEGHHGFGSGRGYIWSTTIPMLKNYMFLGSGPDTYCLVYPQGDYAAKYSSPTYHTQPNIIIDKPHNMFMGMWVNTGFISMAAWLVMVGMYALQSIKLYSRKNFRDEYLYYIGSGIFFGVIGFAFSGLVNDSTVSTMPMFYGLLGTGIAINWILAKAAKDRKVEA